MDISATAGLRHVFPNGGEHSKAWILETTGSGAAFFDFNADGLPDAFVVSGEGGTNRLYANLGGRRFADVTERAGLRSEGWGQGACVGDVDNDGFADLFVTYWGENRLYRNRSGARFERLPVPDSGSYSTGCAFLDADRDGDLDLFIANYLEFDFERTPKPGQNPYCFYRNIPVACGPRGLPFARNEFLRNDGAGRFTDASLASGISAPGRNYSLGAVSGDFDGDGWTDIYVACDRTPSILYINQRDGTFRDEAVLRGAAFDEHGEALSGMGVAAGDIDGDGHDDIFRTNFSDERSTLYSNRGGGDFDDATVHYGLGINTRFVGWGCGFLDADNDGWRDILLVNGHVFPEVETLEGSDLSYREPPVLYRSLRGERFKDISAAAGPGLRQARPARGLAVADVDNDGRVEVLINGQNERPALLAQQGGATGNWIVLQLAGSVSNRSAIGAKARVTSSAGTQRGEVRGGGSYLSQHDLRLHFGLGPDTEADVELRWPSGLEQRLPGLAAGQVHAIREPSRRD
ncbi:MAG: CRTAC1 family protein [Bryobacterales bacterium]|nr:CRTAC1 family protein [Bryobacterales bacterium]